MYISNSDVLIINGVNNYHNNMITFIHRFYNKTLYTNKHLAMNQTIDKQP